MIRILLFSVSLIVLFTFLNLYVNETYQNIPRGRQENKGTAQDISIRAYGKSGFEWTLKGKSLSIEGRDVMLSNALMQTDKERIDADRAFINRDTLRGYVEGNVEIFGEDFYARTERAELDLKEGKVWGEGYILLREGSKETTGTGFQVQLRPLKIIIKKAKVRMG